MEAAVVENKKKIIHSAPAKAIAFIASVLLTVLCIGFALVILWMAELGAYSSPYSAARRNALEVDADMYMDRLVSFADLKNTAEWLEWLSQGNIYASVSDSEGNLILDTTDGKFAVGEEGTDQEDASGLIWFTRTQNGLQVELYVGSASGTSTEIGRVNMLFNFCYRMRNASIICGGLSALLLIADLVFLFSAAGRKAGVEGVALRTIDRIPFDVLTAGCLLPVAWLLKMVAAFGWEGRIIAAICAYVLILSYALSAAVRIKSGTLIANNLIYKLVSLLVKLAGKLVRWAVYTVRELPTVPKAALAAAAEAIVELIVLNLFFERTIIPWLIVRAVVFAVIILTASSVKKLRSGAERIAAGKIDNRVDTKYMASDLLKLAESLNRIGEGLEIAVEQRMKSERFRTELITNVSHDIKTPLTSIINYVDIIKKKGPVNAEIDGYVNVLERQSKQLKKLIEDLMEASKASTGNIAVNMERCDLSVAVTQAVGEYRERIENCGIEVVVSVPEKPVLVMADGRHLWRILDNTLNNVVKYALGGTRFYASVLAVDEKAIVVLRNISRERLNVRSEELAERFVRGDSSRHTEGSGLGLNIAKSLAELQNACFDIIVDGDLFKIVITFDSLKCDGEED